tara:strand:- start:1676 stop:3352 length:1677 start_codon:yes stop_codon:yes gene_type:complete
LFSLNQPNYKGEALSGLVQSGVLDTIEGEAFQRVAWLISEVLDMPVTLISLLNGERCWLRSELEFTSEEILGSLAEFLGTIPSSEILEINDAHVDASCFDCPIVDRPRGVRFIGATTITDPAGFPCGYVTLLDTRPRKLSQNERTKLRCFTDQLESEIKILSLMSEEANLRFEVSRAFNAKSTFLSHMSHEIRTPIAGIIGATDLLLAGGRQETPELLNTIRTSASDLLQLLNETLDSAKIEAGGLHIESVPVDLYALREKLHRHFTPLAASKSLELSVRVEIEDDLPELVFSDPMRLRQVLFNVMHNATKFTERGRIDCRIGLVSLNETHAMLKMKVSDTGIGMTQGALSTLFEPFRQADEGDERQHQGTGLGMTLVKQLTERMGGRVLVDSTPGQGTCICMDIPVLPVDDLWIVEGDNETVSEEPSRPAIFDQDSGLDGLQVLVADDNPQNRLILEKVVTSWGCEVTTVDDGESALKEALEHAFDAIILDLHMPRRSGFEVARSIRQYTSSTTLIACSADTTQAAFAKCQDAGFDAQIEKPFNWPMLHEALLRRAG